MNAEEAEEYARQKPCVRSGFCCKSRPCGYGAVTSPTNPACMFLQPERELLPGVTQYRCGKYEWIMENVPEQHWRMSPAFGTGCSSTLFNTDRDRVLRVLAVDKP